MELWAILATILLVQIVCTTGQETTTETVEGLTSVTCWKLVFPQGKNRTVFENGLSYPDCGRVSSSIPEETEGSKEAVNGRHPWHVRISCSKFDDVFDGTLISKRAIVTHASGFFDLIRSIEPFRIQVLLGAYNFSNPNEPTRQQVNAIQIITLANYKPLELLRFSQNIGLIILEENAIQLNEYVYPACLWNEDFDTNSIIGTTGEVVAWQRNENQEAVDSNLQRNFAQIIPYEECVECYAFMLKPMENACATFQVNTSALAFEMGAGFVVKKDGRSYLRGFMEARFPDDFSNAKSEVTKCSPLRRTLVEDLALSMDWILDHVPDITRL